MKLSRCAHPGTAAAFGFLLAAIVLFFVAPGSTGLAEASQVDMGQLERELMNPCENCGGKPLAGSYCGGAAEAKAELKQMVDKGMTHDEIIDAFVAQYGEWILAVPERKGFNLFAWILPVVGMVAGGGGLALFLRRTNEARRGETGSHGASGPAEGEPAPGRVAEERSELEALRRRLDREVRED
jgi:cytochrome c-type biogenesis protein CcmH